MHYLTIVGSQETPQEPFKALRLFAEQAVREFTVQVRSGGAKGADTAAELGVVDCLSRHGQVAETDFNYKLLLREHLRVYLPYNGFRGHRAHALSPYVDAKTLEHYEGAKARALEIHPNPHALLNAKNNFALLAHTRNMFQVLGDNLSTPSTLLICWAPVDKHGDAMGGTRTAWMTAKSEEIPAFNLSIHTYVEAFDCLSQLVYPTPKR